MRITHLEAHLEQQLTLNSFIANAYEDLIKVGLDRLNSQRIQSRLSTLKEEWDKFSIAHEAIGIAIRELTDKERTQIQNHIYFKENIFANTRERYLETLERISLLFDDGNHKEPTTLQPILNTTSSTQSFYPTRLPRIDLPKFNGTLSNWLSFKDLFTSLVSLVSNPALTSVEKLQYLKTSVVGSAAHLLKNTTLTADNFQKLGLVDCIP